MKLRLFILAQFFLINTTFSQTKLIFHKSHSGSVKSFTLTTSANPGNFGAAPTIRVKTAVLDTLKYLPDGKVVMVTSEYCTQVMRGERYRNEGPSERREPFDKKGARLWEAGRDTLVNHALFSRRHELDNIKDSLKNAYFFQNDIDSVVFIGYDNQWTNWRQKVEKRKGMLIPAPSDGGSGGSLLILTFVATFLAGAFLFSIRRGIARG